MAWRRGGGGDTISTTARGSKDPWDDHGASCYSSCQGLIVTKGYGAFLLQPWSCYLVKCLAVWILSSSARGICGAARGGVAMSKHAAARAHVVMPAARTRLEREQAMPSFASKLAVNACPLRHVQSSRFLQWSWKGGPILDKLASVVSDCIREGLQGSSRVS